MLDHLIPARRGKTFPVAVVNAEGYGKGQTSSQDPAQTSPQGESNNPQESIAYRPKVGGVKREGRRGKYPAHVYTACESLNKTNGGKGFAMLLFRVDGKRGKKERKIFPFRLKKGKNHWWIKKKGEEGLI